MTQHDPELIQRAMEAYNTAHGDTVSPFQAHHNGIVAVLDLLQAEGQLVEANHQCCEDAGPLKPFVGKDVMDEQS